MGESGVSAIDRMRESRHAERTIPWGPGEGRGLTGAGRAGHLFVRKRSVQKVRTRATIWTRGGQDLIGHLDDTQYGGKERD